MVRTFVVDGPAHRRKWGVLIPGSIVCAFDESSDRPVLIAGDEKAPPAEIKLVVAHLSHLRASIVNHDSVEGWLNDVAAEHDDLRWIIVSGDGDLEGHAVADRVYWRKAGVGFDDDDPFKQHFARFRRAAESGEINKITFELLEPARIGDALLAAYIWGVNLEHVGADKVPAWVGEEAWREGIRELKRLSTRRRGAGGQLGPGAAEESNLGQQISDKLPQDAGQLGEFLQAVELEIAEMRRRE